MPKKAVVWNSSRWRRAADSAVGETRTPEQFTLLDMAGPTFSNHTVAQASLQNTELNGEGRRPFAWTSSGSTHCSAAGCCSQERRYTIVFFVGRLFRGS